MHRVQCVFFEPKLKCSWLQCDNCSPRHSHRRFGPDLTLRANFSQLFLERSQGIPRPPLTLIFPSTCSWWNGLETPPEVHRCLIIVKKGWYIQGFRGSGPVVPVSHAYFCGFTDARTLCIDNITEWSDFILLKDQIIWHCGITALKWSVNIKKFFKQLLK